MSPASPGPPGPGDAIPMSDYTSIVATLGVKRVDQSRFGFCSSQREPKEKNSGDSANLAPFFLRFLAATLGLVFAFSRS